MHHQIKTFNFNQKKQIMSKHLWSAGEHRIVLDEILQRYKSEDFNNILLGLSVKLNVSLNSVKGLYKSFSRISQGFEPNPKQGGPGCNWGKNVEFSFSEWKSINKLTQSKINIIFS